MSLSKQETVELYRRRAKRYDLAVWIYRLFGFQIDRYRTLTIEALKLRPGDTVVELGCGTGLNFSRLQRAVGGNGRIIGVDLTDAMLDVARNRVETSGWTNVELVQIDMVDFEFPLGVAGVFSTLAITLVEEYDAVIRNAAEVLPAGKRLAIFDMKKPEGWPDWLVRLAARLNQPFGVSLEIADRQPQESIRQHLQEKIYREYYRGALYLSVGEKSALQT